MAARRRELEQGVPLIGATCGTTKAVTIGPPPGTHGSQTIAPSPQSRASRQNVRIGS